jgi:hypothetical protein
VIVHHTEIDKDAELTVQDVSSKGSGPGLRGVVLSPLEAVDGSDSIAVGSAPSPESGFMGLSEKQTRALTDKLNAIVDRWDEADDDFGK